MSLSESLSNGTCGIPVWMRTSSVVYFLPVNSPPDFKRQKARVQNESNRNLLAEKKEPEGVKPLLPVKTSKWYWLLVL